MYISHIILLLTAHRCGCDGV